MSDKFLVKFTADWCGPCRSMEPGLVKLVEDFDAEIYEVDVDSLDTETLREYGVVSIPVLLFYSDEQNFERVTGAIPPRQVMEKLGL